VTQPAFSTWSRFEDKPTIAARLEWNRKYTKSVLFLYRSAYICRVEFEFDPEKSLSNKLKHGIDFEEAQELWDFPSLVAPSDRGDEARYVRIAPSGEGKFWTAAFAKRGDRIRLISVRRSRKEEREVYERKTKGK